MRFDLNTVGILAANTLDKMPVEPHAALEENARTMQEQVEKGKKKSKKRTRKKERKIL
jgi:hypothetical protein